MGKARQIQLDRIVALKILPPDVGDDTAFSERFAREAKALAKLSHPGIVHLRVGRGVLPDAHRRTARQEDRTAIEESSYWNPGVGEMNTSVSMPVVIGVIVIDGLIILGLWRAMNKRTASLPQTDSDQSDEVRPRPKPAPTQSL